MNSRIEEMADLRSAKNPKARIKILKGTLCHQQLASEYVY